VARLSQIASLQVALWCKCCKRPAAKISVPLSADSKAAALEVGARQRSLEVIALVWLSARAASEKPGASWRLR